MSIEWLAGLFEGEGCICQSGRGVYLTINMSDEDVVRRAHAVAGVGHVTGPYQPTWTPNAKLQWRWGVTRWEDVAELMQLLRPHMGARRTIKIDETFAYRERKMEAIEKRYKARKYMRIADQIFELFSVKRTKIGDSRGVAWKIRELLGLTESDMATLYKAMHELEARGVCKLYRDAAAKNRVKFSTLQLTERGRQQKGIA